ncbi:MAG: hypothetical protein WA751_02595 [Candidatus Dormiibacterota bacterium]
MATQLPGGRPTAQGTQLFLEQSFDQLPPRTKRWLGLFKIDLAPDHAQPSPARWLAALVVANASSLISDAILVAIGTTIFPSTRDFPHFQLSDYGKLTLIGVSIACLAWPFVTRISSRPRWLFIRAAVLVTLLLWLPDLWILVHGEPIRGVAVLMLMHLSIAFITYNTLVRVAPVGPSIGSPGQRVRSQPQPP